MKTLRQYTCNHTFCESRRLLPKNQYDSLLVGAHHAKRRADSHKPKLTARLDPDVWEETNYLRAKLKLTQPQYIAYANKLIRRELEKMAKRKQVARCTSILTCLEFLP